MDKEYFELLIFIHNFYSITTDISIINLILPNIYFQHANKISLQLDVKEMFLYFLKYFKLQHFKNYHLQCTVTKILSLQD